MNNKDTRWPEKLFLRKDDLKGLDSDGAEGDVHVINSPQSIFITHTLTYVLETVLQKERDDSLKTLSVFMVSSTEALANAAAEKTRAAQEAKDDALENLWKELNRWIPTLHFCMEWDGLLIQNGDQEFEACRCGPFPLKYKRAQASESKCDEDIYKLGVSHGMSQARESLREEIERLRAALESISRETIYTYDDGNEGPMIKMRAKETARAALSAEGDDAKKRR